MKWLNKNQLDALLLNATTIEKDGHGLKVAQLANGQYLKLYRNKPLFSSALLGVPAERFARNAKHLISLGISAPAVIDILKIPDLSSNGLIYHPLAGENLRTRWSGISDPQRDTEVQRFGQFLAQLHQLGVYFRSLHLGNVLMLPDESFGLIDLSDMHISGKPLAMHKRKRNVRHMLRYATDSQWLANAHKDSLLLGYAGGAGKKATEQLHRALQKAWSKG